MPTLGDMKERLAREIDAQDGHYAEDIDEAIEAAIRHHSKQRFYFCDKELNVPLVVGQEYYDVTSDANIPDLHKIDAVHIVQSSTSRYELDRVNNEVISGYSTFTNSDPVCYAYTQKKIRVYPPPHSATDSIKVLGWVRQGSPELDTDENDWTNEAYDLIYYGARARLEDDVLENDQKADRFYAKERDELLSLMNISNEKTGTGYVEGTET